MRIPRRPEWTRDMTAEELQERERLRSVMARPARRRGRVTPWRSSPSLPCAPPFSFLEWRRSLSELQDNADLLLTPFERNLDFWRQLWRVIERR